MQFRATVPQRWLSPAHQQVLATLRSTAGPEDVLAALREDVGWLAAVFPGRHYAGHFFLTVDYERKTAELKGLGNTAPEARARFLRDHGITMVFVNVKNQPGGYYGTPGLVPLVENNAGTLFRFTPDSADGT